MFWPGESKGDEDRRSAVAAGRRSPDGGNDERRGAGPTIADAHADADRAPRRTARGRAAAFRVDQALSPLFPQITGAFTAAATRSASSSQNPSTSFIPGGSRRTATTYTETPFDPVVARISLSQMIFDFGKNFASTEAARKLADVALEDTELQRQLVTQTVKESFTNINFAVRLIQVQQQAVDRAELNLRSARGFFEVGTRPKSDVARAEVDVANAKVDLIRARNAERLARVALATAMGIQATTPLQIQDNLLYQPVTLDRTRLAEDALRQRPEYR